MQQLNCSACDQSFLLAPEDLKFYKKLNIPSPTYCSDCRVQRRMSWRNDRTFYTRKSSLSGISMISIYPPDALFPVYQPKEWYGDAWNPLGYGLDYDFSKPFFEQWQKLMLKVPRLGVDIVNCENSDYCNYCGDDKNCYLDIAGEKNEDCYYNLFTKNSRNCVDCTFVYNSELCYEGISCYRCYNVVHSIYLEDSFDCFFCFDLKGCKNCLFCSNLRQSQYCIFNKEYNKQDYLAQVEKLKLNTYSGLTKAKERWWNEVVRNAIHRDMYTLNSENCRGNDIKSSKNCQHVFNISDCEDCKYLYDVLNAKDCYDLNYSLYDPEVSCELISTLNMKFSAFCMASHYCNNAFYCDLCNHSSNLFGCIGLHRKEYCILNKEYSKEDYLALRSKIIEQMQQAGEWGEFFPTSISAFGYNETVAQEYFPLSKEEALKRGFLWREKDEQITNNSPKIEIPDDIAGIPSDFIRQVFTCEVSGKSYRIISQELKFYQNMRLPLPRRSPYQRHQDRLERRNSRKLLERVCTKCKKKVASGAPADSPYKIYCEECYSSLVYK